MPGVDGYELLRRIRERGLRAGWYTPAVAVSAFADADAEARAHAAGFERFLTKPYQLADLVAAVGDVSRPNPDQVPVR